VTASSSLYSFAIFTSYSRIAFRNLSANKGFSIINIVCLSIGMSVGLLALAAFIDMTEVDAFQQNSGNVYRITTKVDDAAENREYASTSAPLAGCGT